MVSAANILPLFVTSLKSVGTVLVLASIGLYLHRRKFVLPAGKRTLAIIAQQVAFPLFFFTRLIDCPQNGSDEACPDVIALLSDAWILVIWPLFVVGAGFAIGACIAKIVRAEREHVRPIIAAVGLGNSSGMALTLLTVLYTNFPSDTPLGAQNPTIYLSIYQLLYPILQWGIGGWLLSQQSKGSNTEESDPEAHGNGQEQQLSASTATETRRSSVVASLRHNVLNDRASLISSRARSMLLSADECICISEVEEDDHSQASTAAADESNSLAENNNPSEASSIWQSIKNVLKQAITPPAIGSIIGIFVAAIPAIRGIFVDMNTRTGNAPLEWVFNGWVQIANIAVPMNMIVLGVNMSMSATKLLQRKQKKSDDIVESVEIKNDEEKEEPSFSKWTVMGIIVGKLILVPAFGIAFTWLLKSYAFSSLPRNILEPMCLVMMVVCITPTANCVGVMTELTGSTKAKEQMTNVIVLQNALAPIIVSLTMTVAVGVASMW